ncbi:DUF4328 domain-containing protein [Promicromonospora sp. Marseille-Q5078]
MTHPDPFAPPSGAVPPATTPPVERPAPPPAAEPRYGAYAPPGSPLAPPVAGVPGTTAPTAPAVRTVPTGLATATIAMAAVWTVLQLALLATSLGAVAPDDGALASGGSSAAVRTAYDVLGSVTVPVQVATFVVACLWLQQCRATATALSPSVRQVRRPVWVWLGWVVPVVSLWFPFQVVRDVRAAAVGTPASTASTASTASRGLGGWWACWLVGLWASNQAAFASSGLGFGDPAAVPAFEGLAAVAAVAGVVLWVGLVREITGALRARLAPGA